MWKLSLIIAWNRQNRIINNTWFNINFHSHPQNLTNISLCCRTHAIVPLVLLQPYIIHPILGMNGLGGLYQSNLKVIFYLHLTPRLDRSDSFQTLWVHWSIITKPHLYFYIRAAAKYQPKWTIASNPIHHFIIHLVPHLFIVVVVHTFEVGPHPIYPSFLHLLPYCPFEVEAWHTQFFPLCYLCMIENSGKPLRLVFSPLIIYHHYHQNMRSDDSLSLWALHFNKHCFQSIHPSNKVCAWIL